jgi:hypothetical protein
LPTFALKVTITLAQFCAEPSVKVPRLCRGRLLDQRRAAQVTLVDCETVVSPTCPEAGVTLGFDGEPTKLITSSVFCAVPAVVPVVTAAVAPVFEAVTSSTARKFSDP